MLISPLKFIQMSKTSNIKIKNILSFLKKLPVILVEHSFLSFFIFLLISVFLGSFIFYQYVILAETKEPDLFIKPTEFKEETYQEILKTWEEREKQFDEASPQNYLDPFRPMGEKWDPEAFLEEKGVEAISELSGEKLESVLAILNLWQFYTNKGGGLPSIAERAEIWEELGLGKKENYYGSLYQNTVLLAELKKVAP